MRRNGATTRQMQQAPQGAVYVWVNDVLGYPQQLARELGREDLEVVSPSWLGWPGRYQGRPAKPLVIDHAAHLTENQRIGRHYVRTRWLMYQQQKEQKQ